MSLPAQQRAEQTTLPGMIAPLKAVRTAQRAIPTKNSVRMRLLHLTCPLRH